MKEKKEDTTPPYVRYFAPVTRPFPDFDFFFIKPLRQKAVKLLNLQQGSRVLDVGCGSGASFPYLVSAVGSSGEVIGVEISPEFSINARRRVEKNGWKNVQVIESAAQRVNLTGTFDALLMMAAPDVYASQEALDNIFPHLRGNAKVVIFGAKTSSNPFGRILNPVFQMVFSKFSFPTTPSLNHQPWQILAKRLETFDVEEYFFGWIFLASGSVLTRNG